MSHKFSEFFLPKLKKKETKENVFYVVAFDLTGIQTCLASQNEHQYPSFVLAKKWPEKIVKLPNSKVVTFEYELTICMCILYLDIYVSFPYYINI